MLKRTLLYLLTLLLCIACQQDDISPDVSHRGTSLTITFRAPSHSTRGIQDLDDDGNVTEAELMRDGQKMYRVSVYLVSGGVVERHQQLEYAQLNDDKTEATVTFDQLDYTKAYQLYAVANHGNYTATGISLTGCLSDLPDDQSPQDIKLSTGSTDYICDKAKVYPLTLQKEIHLNPGANTVSGELVRTFARVRINVRNQSTSNDLQLTSLTFPAMTQASANIFAPAASTNYAPVSTSAYAITPFEADMNLAKVTTDGNVTEKTIFDAYILEGTGGTYSFNLGLRYVGQVASEGYTIVGEAVTQKDKIEANAMYILYQQYQYDSSNNGYVYANVYAEGKANLKWSDSYVDSEGKIDPNYVWQFKEMEGEKDKYALASMGSSGDYITSKDIPNISQIPLIKDNAQFLTVGESGDKLLKFQTSSSSWTGAAYYLNNVKNEGSNEVWAKTTEATYILYKVTYQGGSSSTVKAESTPTIPINIIDNKTGVATPLTSIKRNDFIEITVNASFNEKQGAIVFNTTNWQEGGGDVTFN
ncbi:MAG: hypothetical protein IKB39_07920 [Bacteroidaceae bacterium]|nr:hypothetical protein [Bacteroidaceae bacterium]